MTAPVIQFKRGLLANLPGLRAGEPGFTTDSYDFYIGLTSETSTNKFFGSHRYWTKDSTTTGSGVNFVEGTNNGTSYITLKAADSLAGVTTFTLPSADGTNGQILTTNGSGVLSFSSPAASSFTVAGDSGSDTFNTGETLTFAGTAKEINTTVTNNQVQIGLPDDVVIANNFKVSGISTFVGAVTFEGGTITLGDAASDNVVFAADVNSNIIPNTDATYDFGTGSQRWRNGSFSGIVTATTFDGNLALADITGLGANVSTFLATPSSANLASAVSDETGTGALVFANTPTLVTPVLGTPTSGTLTNCTGLPVSTGISGLGANVASFLATPSSSNLAAALTDETGSGSAVFATSPTLVTPTLGAASATSIEVSGSVNVGTALSAPTVKTATVQHSNGTQAATIDTSGNITASQNLTVSGNLFVNGSTTQVNTSSMTVEDRTIELGQVDGSAPSSATTWDLGVLFNYNASGAKKSAVIWEHADGRFKFGSQVSDGGGTDNNSPQITVSNYAAIEIGSLWVNDCAGQSQVINCSGTTRTLENITIDGGSF